MHVLSVSAGQAQVSRQAHLKIREWACEHCDYKQGLSDIRDQFHKRTCWESTIYCSIAVLIRVAVCNRS